jgi:nucleotide-binding universal stress UspA family protein
MYRSLLVPLDGSDAAEFALPMALSLARKFEASLQIVHVYAPVWGRHGRAESAHEVIDREMRARGQAYNDAVIQRLQAAGGTSLSAVFLEGPIVASAINRQAAASEADLMVMTTQGRAPMARFWLGSVADALLRQAAIPILFVRAEDGQPDLNQEPLLQRVLIPLDGSELAEQILEPSVALAAAMQSEITLLRVVRQLTPASYDPASSRISGIRPTLLKQLEEVDREEWKRAEDYLVQVAQRLRGRSLNVDTRVVSHVRPATAILDDAASHGADLIALATQGYGGLKRLFVGSVADKVLRGATSAVLVRRPAGESASPIEDR